MAAPMEAHITRVAELHNTILARQVITQTLTYPDYTTTAVVTLGAAEPSGGPPVSPPVSSGDSQGSQGLSSSAIGIIIGSIVGAIVLALIIWVGCIIRRRQIEAEIEEYENEIVALEYDNMIQRPRRAYWPRFPMSIPPPAVPTYWARPPQTTYTANGAGRRASSSYVYYDDRRYE
ncbi:hypothetical protein F4808DRAFT_398922 [Astrocystis sublimbata]|nr:hypothetical protein F4808DRAFT_398922 [Astrocystis sublimbata]